jgi:hypothetical protein
MKKLININFDSKIDSKVELEKIVNKAYQKNKNFFGRDLTEIKINFLYQRSQMDEICKYKTEDWQVGWAENKNIYIFSPSVFEKVSNHPNSDFPYTLTHEIAHLFSNEILGFAYPKWLYEGLAGYVAEQYKIRPVKKIDEFSNLHDKEDWKKFSNYSQAYSFTKYLIEKLGKEKILKFLENLYKNFGHCPNFKDFTGFFEKFFDINFNKIISNWQKTFTSQN